MCSAYKRFCCATYFLRASTCNIKTRSQYKIFLPEINLKMLKYTIYLVFLTIVSASNSTHFVATHEWQEIKEGKIFEHGHV